MIQLRLLILMRLGNLQGAFTRHGHVDHFGLPGAFEVVGEGDGSLDFGASGVALLEDADFVVLLEAAVHSAADVGFTYAGVQESENSISQRNFEKKIG